MTKLEILTKAIKETETTLVNNTPEKLAKRWTKAKCEDFADSLYKWYERRKAWAN